MVETVVGWWIVRVPIGRRSKFMRYLEVNIRLHVEYGIGAPDETQNASIGKYGGRYRSVSR